MQPVCLQLESPRPTLGPAHQRQAGLLPPHEPDVVAAVVRAPVLRALVSPNMPLNSLFLFCFNTLTHFSLLQPLADGFLRGATTPPRPAWPARASKPAASGSPRQPGGPDERAGRRDPERRGAESGLAGLGLHRLPCRGPAQHRLLLLLLQPLCHGDDGHAGALPVSYTWLQIR